jgi:hypothetical protein
VYNPKILKEISRLPQVKSIETYVSPNGVPVTAAGTVDTHSPLFTSNFDPIASLNGLYFNQDRMTILQGTRPDPRRPDEAMVNEFAAKLLDSLNVGHRLFLSVEMEPSRPDRIFQGEAAART